MEWEEAQYVIDETVNGIEEIRSTGLEPSNMPSISISVGKNVVEMVAYFPNDTIIDGQLICKVEGVLVIKNSNNAPKNHKDGIVIGDFKKKDYETNFFRVIDHDIHGNHRYYYHFYPYSDHNTFNENDSNLRNIFVRFGDYIWGFTQDFLRYKGRIVYSIPRAEIGLTDMNLNAVFSPMMTNSANGEVTAGSWGSFLTDVLKNKPYMVRRDGTADYQLDPNDYTKKLNGEPSDYNNLDYDGGAFAWLNKLYMKEMYGHGFGSSTENPEFGLTDEGGSCDQRVVLFSNFPREGFEPIGFVDPDGNELEGVWIPMGYMDNVGRVLISGTTPVTGKTVAENEKLIKSFSPRAVFFGGPILNVLRDLEYLMFRTTDIQKAAGYGACSSTSVGVNAVINNCSEEFDGWFGSGTKTDQNKYFHSQVLGSYRVMQQDPYYLYNDRGYRGPGCYYSPHYIYDLTGRNLVGPYINYSFLTGANNKIEWLIKLSNKYFPSYGSTPVSIDYWSNENPSSSTYLCDSIRVPQRSFISDNGIVIFCRLGCYNAKEESGPTFIDQYSCSGTTKSGLIGASLMLLPPVGYEPPMVD